jgi:extracellular elastinolytic metalloproteinase
MILRRMIPVLAVTLSALCSAPIPRHLLSLDGPLTPSSPRPARDIAADFTAQQLPAPAGLYLANEYKSDHNGVTHLTYRQRFQGLDIFGAEWRINIDKDGRVLNAGGELFTPPTAQPANAAKLPQAAQAALSAVNPILARQSTLRRSGMTSRGDARFVSSEMGKLTGRPVWFPVRGTLQPAWHFIVTDADGISAYDTVIDDASQSLLSKQALTMFQSAPQGAVFTGISPQPPVKYGVQSTEEPPYVQRAVVPFPNAWISGAETVGNNAVAGANPAGIVLLPNPLTTKSPSLDFQFPLQLGPDAPASTNFTDAVTTNLFYWVNRTHDLFNDLGFNEAAGNYQAQNVTGAGISGDPMFAYSQFGSQALTGSAALNNAFFTTRTLGDGNQAQIAMYVNSIGGIWADSSLAADTIIHEYTHGVTFRLIPTMNTGFQGAAMNEALSDFWAMEFLIPEGSPVDGVYPRGEYSYRAFGTGLRNRPISTNLEINPLTYADLGRAAAAPQIHEDGVIWIQALWEVRANLIRQFGETEGRRRLRHIVLDGMKLSPPAPSMVDLRDAILLAERVDYKGESQSQIWEGFARRGLGVLAYSPNSNSIQVTPSFDKPSTTGAIGLQTDMPMINEPLRITVYDANYTGDALPVDVTASSGDVVTVILTRGNGLAWSGTLFTTAAGPVTPRSPALSVLPGDSITVYYNDLNTATGPKLIEKTVKASPNYGAVFETEKIPFTFPNETATGFRFSPGGSWGRVALPFAFPFYGKKYREIRVRPEGYIQFDTALTPTCLDDAGFAAITGIAPMAMWMRTNGSAQPGENIYTSRGPNSFTIRWAGETIPAVNAPPYTPVPEPVNFALTLYENGEIQYLYGAGNQNLLNYSPFAGCAATTPFVGISRGIGNAALQHIFGRQRATLKDAPPLSFFPPFENATTPKVRIESPAPDASVAGVLTVRGIVYDEDTLVSSVNYLIDGVFRGILPRGINRPDICTTPATLPGCPSVGFLANLNVKALGLKPGPHTFQLRAVNFKGGFQDYPESPLTFTVEDNDGPLPIGGFDTLKDGDVWTGFVPVRGFAYSKSTRVTAVDLIIDNIAYGRTSFGVARPDLCAANGPANGAVNCPGVGWVTAINTTSEGPALRNGEHSVQIRITEDNGRITYQPETPVVVTVENAVNKLPIGVITTPTNAQRVSGVINISGHAYDPDGRFLAVYLLIDDQIRATLRYGNPRPEVCATLTGVAACPNIGFDGTFDTRLLANGNHRLGVLLLDANDATVVAPLITNAGMNITVNNP